MIFCATGASREALVNRYEAEIASLQNQVEEKMGTIAALRTDGEAQLAELEALSQKKLELEAERTAKDRESREKNDAVLQLEREVGRLEQKKATSAMEEKQILDRLWDTYELSYEDARAQSVELESLSKTNRRIGELRREISALGTPNIGAIEEFDRVNTRYEYLSEQRGDVEKAKEELLGVIGGITAEMQRIFKEQFALDQRKLSANVSGAVRRRPGPAGTGRRGRYPELRHRDQGAASRAKR